MQNDPTQYYAPVTTFPRTPYEYPRNSANRFIPPEQIVKAATDITALDELKDSIPQEEHSKLHSAISCLQSGGTVNHPSDLPGMGINISGIIPDPRWNLYAHDLKEYKAWRNYESTRAEYKKDVDRFIRSARRDDPSIRSVKSLISIHEQREELGITEMRRLLDTLVDIYDGYVNTCSSFFKESNATWDSIDSDKRLLTRIQHTSCREVCACIEVYVAKIKSDSDDKDIQHAFDELLTALRSAYRDTANVMESIADNAHQHIERSHHKTKEWSIPKEPTPPASPPVNAPFGMVGDEWHGSKPPSESNWVSIAPGPRGGKRWRHIGGNNGRGIGSGRTDGGGNSGTDGNGGESADGKDPEGERTKDTSGAAETVQQRVSAGDLKPQIVTARSEYMVKPDITKVPEQLRKYLVSPNGQTHQLEGAAAAIGAIDRVGGFLLADGAGAGKTRQMLAVAKTYADRGKKIVMVAPAGIIKPDWDNNTVSGSIGGDGQAMGIDIKLNRGDKPLAAGDVCVTTYESLKTIKNVVDSDTVVIFDEAHGLKNATSARAQHGRDVATKAMGVLYGSATPADSVRDIAYLFRTKLFGNEPWEETRKKFSMKKLGASEVLKNVSEVFDKLTKDGIMIKREISLDGVAADFNYIELPEEMKQSLEGMKADNSPSARAQLLMRQRRMQERFKIPYAVNAINKELAEGRQVVIFVAGVGGEGEETGTAGMLHEALANSGINPDEVAELHGGEDGGGREVVKAFQDGEAKVLITTAQSGGTGHNFDDVVGDTPRTQIILTPPFSAIDNSQIWGRTHRLTTRSKSRIKYVFANTSVDRWNAKLIKNKMKTLSAIVGGESLKQSIPDSDLTLSLIDGEWHGLKPPSYGSWVITSPGPRGGTIWRRVDGSNKRRRRRNDGVSSQTSGRVGDSIEEPSRGEDDRAADNSSESAGTESNKNGKAKERIERLTKRLDAYKDYFYELNYEDAAEWVDSLKKHINKTGINNALKSLRSEKPARSEGERVQYIGTSEHSQFDKDEYTETVRNYLDNVGITFLSEDTIYDRTDDKLIASAPVPSAEELKRDGDIVARNTNLEHKLQEAKLLPGLSKSEDIHTLVGHTVDKITPKVMSKLDKVYGKDNWVIKSYGAEAYAGFGVFFPERIREISRASKQAIWESDEQLNELGYRVHRDDDEATGVENISTGVIYRFGTSEYNKLSREVKRLGNIVMVSAPSEYATRLPNTSEDNLTQDYGMKLVKNRNGDVSGIIDSDGSYVKYGSNRWEELEEWDRGKGGYALSRAINAIYNNESDMSYMVQPAFKSNVISEADRKKGLTCETGHEGRVHAYTNNGKVSIVPYATLASRRDTMPAVFHNKEIREMEKAVEHAINLLPKSERDGQTYAPDVMKTVNGWKVIELNASVEGAQSTWLESNPFVIDAFVSHVTNREPGHVKFVRDVLKDREPYGTEGISASMDAHGREHAPAGSKYGGQFISKKSKPEEPKPNITHSKAKVVLKRTEYTTEPMVKEAATIYLGKGKTKQDFATVVGALNDATVSIEIPDDEDSVHIYVDHKYYTAKRKIRNYDSPSSWIYKEEFFVKPKFQDSGIGSEIFYKQAMNASAMGISAIYATAHGGLTSDGKTKMNGYYTWPRLGYDAPLTTDHIDGKTLRKINNKFPNAETLQDVMRTEEGRNWWKENGVSVYDMKFDLSPNSRSMKILKAYMEKRKTIRSK